MGFFLRFSEQEFLLRSDKIDEMKLKTKKFDGTVNKRITHKDSLWFN